MKQITFGGPSEKDPAYIEESGCFPADEGWVEHPEVLGVMCLDHINQMPPEE
jgi:hypothetical protein